MASRPPRSKASPAQKNRTTIELAREQLEANGFEILERHRDDGTLPRAYTIARRNGALYCIGHTGREAERADGYLNEKYNLASSDDDLEQAIRLVAEHQAVPAFVSIAYQIKKGLYSAYFCDTLGFLRQVPMTPGDIRRHRYEVLAHQVSDPRVAALWGRPSPEQADKPAL